MISNPIVDGYVIEAVVVISPNAWGLMPSWWQNRHYLGDEFTLEERTFYAAKSSTSQWTLVCRAEEERAEGFWELTPTSEHVGWYAQAYSLERVDFFADMLSAAETEELTCFSCDESLTEISYEVGNEPYCDDCATRCSTCHRAEVKDDMLQRTSQRFLAADIVYDTTYYCDDCTRTCNHCDEREIPSLMSYVWDDWYCTDSCTTSCGSCGNTIPAGHNYCSEECEYEEDGCGCESPALTFAVRNDGHEPLVNDTQVKVGLPAGVISAEGINQIQQIIYSWAGRPIDVAAGHTSEKRSRIRGLAHSVRSMDWRWQTKEGNFTKRLSKLAYQKHSLKVPPEILSEVGNIGRDHSGGSDFTVDVTRMLNDSPEDFANEGSCWWGSEWKSRCTLKSNGGFGLRTWSDEAVDGHGNHYRWVTGRVWVMPLRKTGHSTGGRVQFEPTFDTADPDAWVLFNGYEDLSEYVGPRLWAQMQGMTYRKIGLDIDYTYINGGSGYLVGPEELVDPWTDQCMGLTPEYHSDLYAEEQAAALSAAETEAVSVDA